MYFKQIDEILSGAKTQTRCVCKPGEQLVYEPHVNPHNVYSRIPGGVWNLATVRNEQRRKWQVGRDYAVSPGRGKPGVWFGPGTKQWGFHKCGEDVSTSYLQSIDWQPLRIRITEIRRQQLQDISEADAMAEGCRADECYACDGSGQDDGLDCYLCAGTGILQDAASKYSELWESINTRKGTRWEDNPDVWVLTFEVVRNG